MSSDATQDLRHRRTDDPLGSLNYIQAMLGQLRTMAAAERYDMLAYFIEMAYLEASDIVRGERPSAVGKEKRNSAA